MSSAIVAYDPSARFAGTSPFEWGGEMNFAVWPFLKALPHGNYSQSTGARSARLEQQHGAQPTIGADADDRARSARHRCQLLHRHADDACAGRAERMAERGAAAVGIEPVEREGAEVARHLGAIAQEGRVLQRLEMERQLRGEGFVDLPEMDVAVAKIVTRQQARNGEGRRHQETLDAEIDGGDLPVDQFYTRRSGGKALQAFRRGGPDRGGAVGERRGVARRQRALAA